MTLPHQIVALTGTAIASDSVATVRAAVSPARRSPATSPRCAARRKGLPAAEIGLRSTSPSPSPPVSPRNGRMRPDLSAACQALMDSPVMAEEENEGAVVREYKEQGGAQVRMEHDF